MTDPYYWGTGRRKTAIARVRMRPGNGVIRINGRPFDQYFVTALERWHAIEPLVASQSEKKWDIWVNAHGGGTIGQAGAIRLGIARALMAATPELERDLRKARFLSRDPRRKERKKYGLHGARKATQWTKR